jgi:tRNA dimethylallyltransferase
MGKVKQKIIVICGPTASGKTSLALQLAKELPRANILSVDSRQVYQDLDIITGKDIPSDLPPQISIFGHDIFEPDQRANLADFVRYSQKIISDSAKENIPLIIVGGTGLYLKAITENLSNVLIPPDEKLRQKLENQSLEQLQNMLREIDPKKYSSLNRSDMMNPRRLVRYFEIASVVNKQNNKVVQLNHPDFFWIGMLSDKDILKKNIRQRVVARLTDGAITEVAELLKKYSDRSLTIFSSLGVSHIINYLDGQISEDQLIEKWTKSEVDYARRQTVWFKKQTGIVWYDKNIDKNKFAQELAQIYLKND